MDHDTEYLQPDVEDGQVELGHESIDADYVGLPRTEVERIDMRGMDVSARKVDLMGLETPGSIYAWSSDIDAELDVSHAEAKHLYLRSASGRDVDAAEGDFEERVELSRSSFETVDLSGVETEILHVEDAAIETIDLSGAAIDRLDADEEYDFVLDEETEIGEIPDELEGMRVYEETTGLERAVLYDAATEDSVLFDAGRTTMPRYSGAVGSLVRKGLLEESDGSRVKGEGMGYAPSDRGEAFLEYIDDESRDMVDVGAGL